MIDNEHRYNPDIHHRRSVRLRDYDYSQQGLYFVTLCVKNRKCIFGKIVVDDCTGRACPARTDIGEIVQNCWLAIPQHYPNTKLHNFVVMPNHFHGIIEICAPVGAGHALPQPYVADDDVGAGHALPLPYVADDDVRAGHALPLPVPAPPKQRTNKLPQSRFQNIGKNTLSSIIGGFKSAVTKNIHDAGYEFAWLRNMWEHVIRDYNDYARIADYIDNNPAKWKEDTFYEE